MLKMPWSSVSGRWESPKIDFVIDMGHPFLNRTVDGFLKIAVVGASKVAAEETYHCVQKAYSNSDWAGDPDDRRSTIGSVSKHATQETLKKMCKEGAYYGAIAGAYVGMEYGMERIRGKRDWKNAMLGGVITGGLVSAASNKKKDQVIVDAITGGAIATAADFIYQLT